MDCWPGQTHRRRRHLLWPTIRHPLRDTFSARSHLRKRIVLMGRCLINAILLAIFASDPVGRPPKPAPGIACVWIFISNKLGKRRPSRIFTNNQRLARRRIPGRLVAEATFVYLMLGVHGLNSVSRLKIKVVLICNGCYPKTEILGWMPDVVSADLHATRLFGLRTLPGVRCRLRGNV